MKPGLKYFKIGIIATGMALLSAYFVPDNEHGIKKCLERKTRAYVKTQTHEFSVEDYFSEGKKFPRIAAFYENAEAEAKKRPSRAYLSSREDGVFDLQFNNPASKCFECHNPVFEQREIRYNQNSKEAPAKKDEMLI
jgi:hypothetical protein